MSGTSRRTVVQGVSLAATMILVAVGVILQFAAMAPAARGEARTEMPLTIVRGDGATERAVSAAAPAPGHAESHPAQEAGRTTSPYRAMRAGWSAPGARTPGARTPERGWTARQVTTPSIDPGTRRSPGAAADGTPGADARAAAAPSGGGEAITASTGRSLLEEAPVTGDASFFASSAPVVPGPLPSRTPVDAVPDTPAPARPFEPAPRPARPGPAADLPEETPEPSAGGTQLNLLGPASARVDDLVTYAVVVENAQAVAHAPLRLAFDPGVLAFVEAGEGDFLSTDGAGIQFLASEADTPGLVDIALSRLGAGAGITGSGTLCTVTFRIVGNGVTSIAMSGSRLLDASSRPLGFRRNDSHVAVD